MHRSMFRGALSIGVACCHLAVSLLVTTPSFAQEVDREPPTIVYEPLERGRQGDRQVFSVTVTDNVEVESVTLRYRPAGTVAFAPVPMTSLSGTDIRTASIENLDPEVSVIEYYIEARDTAGNRSIEGFAFEPLERRLVDPAVPLAEDGAVVVAGGLSTEEKILYGVLGVIVVGALVASASGGDSGGGGANEVPVRILTPQLQP